MQAQQMAASLHIIASLADPKAAETIVRLAEALAGQGSKPFGALATKLEKGLKAKAYYPGASCAADIVRRMADVSSAAGARPLSKEFAIASRLLETLSSIEASQISTVVADALTTAPKKARGTTTAPVDPREMAEKLTEAGSDNAKFDALVSELSKLQKNTLADIAQRYLGITRKFQSKSDIIKSIRARQLQDALDASRDRRISKIAV